MSNLNFKNLLLLAFLIIPFFSCSDDDEPNPQPEIPTSIAEIAADDERFNILVDALVRTDLDGTLDQAGTFTVLAPTDNAFEQLLTDLGLASLDDVDDATLRNILLYHVMGSEVSSTEITTGYFPTLATGPSNNSLSIYVNTASGVTFNGNSNVIEADIEADNGIIHVIDAVIMPANIVELAIPNNEFSSLVNAAVTAGLVDALSADGPFTVFAPTNDAFAQLLSDLGVSSIGEIPLETLTSVLLYHVVPGNVTSSQVTTGMVSTLSEDAQLSIDASSGVVINGDVNVIATDVQGTNGVVHVIDKVLVPGAESNSIVDIAMGDENFSILVDAVVKAGLVETLSGEGNFTVFAPTNDAFVQLLSDLGINSLDDVSEADLQGILLYHVLGQEVFSQNLSTTFVNTLNTNSPAGNPLSLYISIENEVSLNGNVSVIAPDIDADNGVIHVIDKVLLPPSIVDMAVINSSFEELVGAVVRADLATTLDEGGPFTVFAPTDTAFENLYTQLGVASSEEIDLTTLTNVLLYHVVNGNTMSSDLSAGMVPTLNANNDIEVNLTNGVTLNETSNVVITDIQTTNGVIHVIDRVLLPSN